MDFHKTICRSLARRSGVDVEDVPDRYLEKIGRCLFSGGPLAAPAEAVYQDLDGTIAREQILPRISGELLKEHEKTPIGFHSDDLRRVLLYFQRQATQDKYVLLETEQNEEWNIGQLSGVRGVSPSIVDPRSFASPEAAEHAVFRKRVEELRDKHGNSESTTAGESVETDPPSKQIVGYPDVWNKSPGDTLRCRVHCEAEEYRADIVKLRCGDTHPDGPGFEETVVSTSVNGKYPGREQEIHAGSYVRVELPPEATEGSLTVQALIYPTAPQRGEQAILTRWLESEKSGFGLFIGPDGDILFRRRTGDSVEEIRTNQPFEASVWYHVGAQLDVTDGSLQLFQKAMHQETQKPHHPLQTPEAQRNTSVNWGKIPPIDIPLAIGGRVLDRRSDGPIMEGSFNGKIERPALFEGALDLSVTTPLLQTESVPGELRSSLIGCWDFSEEITSEGISRFDQATDISPNQYHGRVCNLPARGVTGFQWTGENHDFTQVPRQYGAIHFHEDDLEDAKWETDFELTVSEEMDSGAYAARLRTNGDESYIPFFICPPVGEPTADLAFLAPTASYQAYANAHLPVDSAIAELVTGQVPIMQPEDVFLSEHREYGGGMYDTHPDGSGVFYSSRLRPLLDMSPKYKHWLSALPSSLWQYNADLHLIDWLEEMDYEYDVVTDHDLHEHGVSLLSPYQTVITGSHPEYYSREMLDAIRDYQHQGGRLMYMGANGFYWCIAFHPQNNQIIEVRRGVTGEKAWINEPGENHMSFTGKKGGLWRDLGQSPQKTAGVGFIGHGFDKSSYYQRQPDSHAEEVSFIFDGIEEEERIGNQGMMGGGAAGLELDYYSEKRGTPSHAHLLASSEGHTDNYIHVVEEVFFTVSGQSGTQDPEIRADMVYYPLPNGGGVFSTGSIAWCGSLPCDNYENSVSKITKNVLDRFLDEEPLP